MLVHADDVLVRQTSRALIVLGATPPPVILRGTAAAIWSSFATPRRALDVADELAATYGEDREVVGREVDAYVEALLHAGLLVRAAATTETQ